MATIMMSKNITKRMQRETSKIACLTVTLILKVKNINKKLIFNTEL